MQPGRLENLKELIRSIDQYKTIPAFLEHISLVMDYDNQDALDAVSLMTLHSARGWNLKPYFCRMGKKDYFHTSVLWRTGGAMAWKKSVVLLM